MVAFIFSATDFPYAPRMWERNADRRVLPSSANSSENTEVGLKDLFGKKRVKASLIPPIDSSQSARVVADSAALDYSRGLQSCAPKFEEVFRWFERVGDEEHMARTALALGRAYMHVQGLRDLEKSKNWYNIALANSKENTTRAQALGSLAIWEQQYIGEHRNGSIVPQTLRPNLDRAENLHRMALELLPLNEHISRAVTHNMLSSVLQDQGKLEEAEGHIQTAIHEYIIGGDPERAAAARLNASSLMIAAKRFRDALRYINDAVQAFAAIPPSERSVDWRNHHQTAIEQRDSIRSYLAKHGATE